MAKKKHNNLYELLIILAIGTLTILFWRSTIVFPIKLFVVLLHEISHGLAATFTGGSIKIIDISTNLGGRCITVGGSELIIASAGYLGSLAFGSSLFLSSYDEKTSKIICTIIAALFVIITASFIQSPLGISFTLGFALLMLLSPRFFNKAFHSYLFRGIGLISCMYVLVDIKEDLLTMTYRITDAQALEMTTGVDALIWGLLWFIISGAVIFFMIRFGFRKGMK